MRTRVRPRRFIIWLVCCALVAAAFELAGLKAAPAAQPANPVTDLSLPTVQDLNPDPRILEINLTAEVARVEISPGRRVEAWTYNGTLPGPLIRLTVGDRLIVHFTNKLPSPTTVHWHGLRVPIQMDGVPGASQPNVETGGTLPTTSSSQTRDSTGTTRT